MRPLRWCCFATTLGLLACGDGPRAGASTTESDQENASDPEHGFDGDAGSADDRPPTDGEQPDLLSDAAALPDGALPVLGDLRINEVDCSAEQVELLNTGDATLELAGFRISDDLDDTVRSQKLSGSIAPGAHHVVTLSSFGISCGDENVVLFRDDEVVDVAPPADAPSAATWGRLPDGSGAFVATAPTLNAANRAFEDESVALYAPLERAVQVRITLSAENRAALALDPRTYVEGSLTLEAGGKTLGPLQVGVRLKGRHGSFQDLDHKAAFKILLDHVVGGQRAFGQEKLTLNNLRQDDTSIHEWLAYRIFSAVGVPAPRVGYAHVTLDGEDYGTYVLVESLDADDLLARNFPSTFAMYEPLAGEDITPDKVPTFDVDEGEAVDRSALLAVANALADPPPGGAYDALKERVDYPEVLREMAVELFTGEWDGYTLAKNNYVIHIDDSGVLRLMPWGADQAFAGHESLFRGHGLLFTTCLADVNCVQLWLAALEDVRATVHGLLDTGIVADAQQLAALNAQRFRTDPRINWDASGLEMRAQAVIAGLQARLDGLTADLACHGTALDMDGDGRSCQLDCSDSDPTRYYGAPEVCGDHVDQDCSGAWDDGPSCPACAPDSALPGYLVCPRSEVHDAAEAACAAAGAQLASIVSSGENAAIVGRAALWFPDRTIWLGLRAPAGSPDFAWSDGSPLSYQAYAPGEPAPDTSDDRCVALRPDGQWTAGGCYSLRPYVCKQ